MDIITHLQTNFLDFVHHLSTVQWIVVGIIALFFGMATGSAVGLFLAPLLGAIVYIAADHVIPPLMHHTSFVMPAFDKAMLHEAIFLYILFFVTILVIFAVKKIVLKITG